jgi:hypothetical protein
MRVCKETMRRRLHVMADATCSVEGYEIYETGSHWSLKSPLRGLS